MEVPSEISTSPFQVQYSVKVLQLLAYAISTTNDLKWPDIFTGAPTANFSIMKMTLTTQMLFSYAIFIDFNSQIQFNK